VGAAVVEVLVEEAEGVCLLFIIILQVVSFIILSGFGGGGRGGFRGGRG
jgi:hypothetical protein